MSDGQEAKRFGPFSGPDALCFACDELLASARRSIRIVCPDLDPVVLNRRAVTDALAQVIRVSPRTTIRVMFADAGGAVREGHRLIECARRFSSYMDIRRLPAEHLDERNSWILVDERHLLWRQDFSRLDDAFLSWRDARMAPKLCRSFDDLWPFSEHAPEMRRLHL